MIESETEQLRDWCEYELKGNSDLFDFNHEIDRTLTAQENKTIIKEKIKHIKKNPHLQYYKGGIQDQKTQTQQQPEEKLNTEIDQLQKELTKKLKKYEKDHPETYEKMMQILALDQEITQKINLLQEHNQEE